MAGDGLRMGGGQTLASKLKQFIKIIKGEIKT